MIVTNNEHADKQKTKAKKIRSKGENVKKREESIKGRKNTGNVFFLINEERSDDLRDTCCKPHNMEADGRKTVGNFKFQ